MPSDKILAKKQEVVGKLAERLNNSAAGVLCDYKGITVEKDTQLRRDLRAAGIEYTVLKNSILLRAAEKSGLEALSPMLTGTTALATSTDPVAGAKALSEFSEKSRGTFKIKGGFVEGKVIDAEGVIALAKLPAREVLISMVLGGLNAPITGFVSVLNANLRGLVVALNAIAEKKSA